MTDTPSHHQPPTTALDALQSARLMAFDPAGQHNITYAEVQPMANEAQQSKIIDGVEVVVHRFAALRIIDGAERIDINTIATTEEEARELARRVRGISDNTITTTAVFVHTRIVPITLVVEIPDQTPSL